MKNQALGRFLVIGLSLNREFFCEYPMAFIILLLFVFPLLLTGVPLLILHLPVVLLQVGGETVSVISP